MKKNNQSSNILDKFQTYYKSNVDDKIKTTDINILLNRVKKNKQIDFKKKIVFSLLLLFISFVAIFFLFK